MDNKKKSGTVKTGEGMRPAENTSEESLLEQIRAKEEEQNARIDAYRRQAATEIENARKESGSRLSRERELVQVEANSVWQEAMGRIESDVERILGEGKQLADLDKKRKEQKFDGMVERVVREISKG
jgi:vacuolar-type H+-ATPase subunit H